MFNCCLFHFPIVTVTVKLTSGRLHLKSCLCSLLLLLIFPKFVSRTHLISFQISSCLSRDWSSKKVISGFEQQTSIHSSLSTFCSRNFRTLRGISAPPPSLPPSVENCTFREWRAHVIKWSDEVWQFPKTFRENWRGNQPSFTCLFLPSNKKLSSISGPTNCISYVMGTWASLSIPNNSAETIHISSKRGSGGVLRKNILFISGIHKQL